MKRAISRAFAVVVALASVAVACNGAKYPSCDNDEGCNTDGHKGVCVDGKCVACRDDAGCAKGEQCKGGQCVAQTDYCDDTHACDGDCKNHHCIKKVASTPDENTCDEDHPCGPGTHCQNGHCVSPPHGGPGCTDFPPPKYAFESPELTDDAKATLKRLAACLTTGTLKGAEVLLIGHCDARGEYEFNMGLGAERAEGAKKLLMSLGVPESIIKTSSRGKLDAVGTDEAGWANDRRVDVQVR